MQNEECRGGRRGLRVAVKRSAQRTLRRNWRDTGATLISARQTTNFTIRRHAIRYIAFSDGARRSANGPDNPNDPCADPFGHLKNGSFR